MKKLFALFAIIVVICSTFAWVTAFLQGEDVSRGASAVLLDYSVTLGPGEQFSDFRVHVNSNSSFSGTSYSTATISNGDNIVVNLSSASGLQVFWRLEDLSGMPITGSNNFYVP